MSHSASFNITAFPFLVFLKQNLITCYNVIQFLDQMAQMVSIGAGPRFKYPLTWASYYQPSLLNKIVVRRRDDACNPEEEW